MNYLVFPDMSDFNIKIDKFTKLKAEPHVSLDFPFAFGGVKANCGFVKGKIYFEVKWTKCLPITTSFGDREVKHVLRVGWSDLYADLQLGI